MEGYYVNPSELETETQIYEDDDGLNYVGAKNKARNMIDMIEEYRMKYSK